MQSESNFLLILFSVTEIFGKVQKVFFRKYTKMKADKLNLKGWVQNTPSGTVVGVAQGSAGNIFQFKNWLERIGYLIIF